MKNKYLLSTLLISLILNLSCKKDNEIPLNTVSFKFNGQVHSYDSQWSPVTNFDINSFRFLYAGGITITRPELFGGTVKIFYNAPMNAVCAFLQPDNYPMINADCNNLNAGGQPIDSVKVYWMESGNFSHNISECTPTATGPFKRCTLVTSFSVTLVNKNNQKIVLTEGKSRSKIELPK